tara:strand:+ start:295 stop:1071 length:777 start_codon:yes stop_codon:yes gene_type:complete
VLSATCGTNSETPENREWDSNATGGRTGSAIWTFPIEKLVSVLHVQAGFCDEKGASCRVLEASFDLPVRSKIFGVPCESDKDPVFAKGLTDMTRIQLIGPPGGVSGYTITQHSYIFMTQGGSERGIPVYAPAESKLVSMRWYKGLQDPKPFYLLTFQFTCEVWMKIDHMTEVVDKIRTVQPTNMSRTTGEGEDLRSTIQFEAGELIGYTSALVLGAAEYGISASITLLAQTSSRTQLEPRDFSNGSTAIARMTTSQSC